jgi:hypothetical protein
MIPVVSGSGLGKLACFRSHPVLSVVRLGVQVVQALLPIRAMQDWGIPQHQELLRAGLRNKQ